MMNLDGFCHIRYAGILFNPDPEPKTQPRVVRIACASDAMLTSSGLSDRELDDRAMPTGLEL